MTLQYNKDYNWDTWKSKSWEQKTSCTKISNENLEAVVLEMRAGSSIDNKIMEYARAE